MDEQQKFSSVHHSLSSAMNTDSLRVPISEISSAATIPYDIRQDNFIPGTVKSENWSPTMPTATQFIPTVTSTATHFATPAPIECDNYNNMLNSNLPMIHENSMVTRDIIIKQENQIIGNEIMNDHRFDFVRPYDRDDNGSLFSAETNATTINHRIHLNPSILLSKHRANYSGPGTPMPNLPNDFYYSQQSTNLVESKKISAIVSRRRKRAKKRQRTENNIKKSKLDEHFASVHPKDFAKLILEAQGKNNDDSKRGSEFIPEKMENNPKLQGSKSKKVDARLWLNAKAKLIAQSQANIATSSSSSTVTTRLRDYAPEFSCRRFIDRATSPINFPEDKQTIKSKTRDIALSPIRFIEPQLKHFRSHSDEGTAMNLSLALSQTIESANKTKILNCLLGSQHNCGRCIVMSRQMVEPICPICYAKKSGKSKKSA